MERVDRLEVKSEQILEHYKSEAARHGLAGTSTIQDERTRRLEYKALSSYMRDGMKVLEVGCGNGYIAEQLVHEFGIRLDAFDFSPDLIDIAQKRNVTYAKGSVTFTEGDVLTLSTEGEYDVVFTDRCVQNLLSWEDQQTALRNIARAVKPGGLFVMLEAFWTGLNNLNEARAELSLPKIDPPWHNLFFYEDQTRELLAEYGCSFREENPFLSGYYFGSRVILPALLPPGKSVTSKSKLNDYFCALPPAGDFCPMKILVFERVTQEVA